MNSNVTFPNMLLSRLLVTNIYKIDNLYTRSVRSAGNIPQKKQNSKESAKTNKHMLYNNMQFAIKTMKTACLSTKRKREKWK